MGDPFYKVLKYSAIFLAVVFLVYSFYDGMIKGKDEYALEIAAGHRHFEDGRYPQALDAFNTALGNKPDDPAALYGLAITSMQLGRNTEALAFFDRAINLSKETIIKAYSLANRGILFDRMGAYENALADYRNALALAPETADGPGFVARLLHNQPEKPPSIADRARYLEAELAKPANERMLSVSNLDARQRTEKAR